jgi:hypothetical protein
MESTKQKTYKGKQEGKTDFIEYVGRVLVTEPNKFIASTNFVCDISPKASVKILQITDEFTHRFVDKVEERKEARPRFMAQIMLSSPATDADIFAKLGKNPEVTLASAHSLLAKQPNGEEGVLLNNYSDNVFYVRDRFSKLCIVTFRWRINSGWVIGANDLGNSMRGINVQVFRNLGAY